MIFDTNRLKTLLSYGGPILIFLGVVRLHLYYQAFGIKIENFLEFTEIVTALFGDLILLTMSIALAILVDFFGATETWVDSSNKFVQSFDDQKGFLTRLSLSFVRMMPYLIPFNGGILLALAITLFKHQNPVTMMWLLFWVNMPFIIVTFQYEIRRKYFKLYGTRINATTSNLFLIFLISVSFLVQRVQTEVWLVKDRKQYINVTFTVDHVLVKSDSTHYYIGNTRNYLFYFDQDSSKTTLYPMSKVSNITFKE